MTHVEIIEKHPKAICAAASEEVALVTRRAMWINYKKGTTIVKGFLCEVKDRQQTILLELVPPWNRRWWSRYRWDMEAFQEIHNDQIYCLLRAFFATEVPILIVGVLKTTKQIKLVNFLKVHDNFIPRYLGTSRSHSIECLTEIIAKTYISTL